MRVRPRTPAPGFSDTFAAPAGPKGPVRLLARISLPPELAADDRRRVRRAIVLQALLHAAFALLRPLRDALGIRGGADDLPWLFTASFIAVALVTPLLGLAAARLGRPRLVAVLLRGLALLLTALALALLLGPAPLADLAARAVFVVVSVANLVAVSLLWSVLADHLRTRDAARVFGLVALGGSLGAIAGPALAAGLALLLDPALLLVVAALLLDAIVRLGRELWRGGEGDGAALGGPALAGVAQIAADPRLRGLALHVLCTTATATVLYCLQGRILELEVHGDGHRTALLAAVDLAINLLALALQGLLTAAFLARHGLAPALALASLVGAAALTALGSAPGLLVLVLAQILRRAVELALARPAREVLFTRVDRAARYQAKGLIDAAVYRAGDALGGWAFAGLAALGLGLGPIAWSALPLALAGAAVGWRLGRDAPRGAATDPEAAPVPSDLS